MPLKINFYSKIRCYANKENKMPGKKKLTTKEKYSQLKKQTESAGMEVKEKNRKLVVSRKKKK